MTNRRSFTPREQMVVEMVAQGRSNPEIAQGLGSSRSTAKQNLANVMIKWNCANRTQVAVEVVRRLDGGTGEAASAPAETAAPGAAPGAGPLSIAG